MVSKIILPVQPPEKADKRASKFCFSQYHLCLLFVFLFNDVFHLGQRTIDQSLRNIKK